MSFNRVILQGNLTRDPEIRSAGADNKVANFGIAVNRRWKDSAGQPQEDVTFVDCTAWGKRGEAIGQYFHKGEPILVEGELRMDQWDDKTTGQKRSKLLVNVTQFAFVGGKRDGDSTNRSPDSSKTPHSDDDIPF